MEWWAGAEDIGSLGFGCLRMKLECLCQDWRMDCYFSHLFGIGFFDHFGCYLIQAEFLLEM